MRNLLPHHITTPGDACVKLSSTNVCTHMQAWNIHHMNSLWPLVPLSNLIQRKLSFGIKILLSGFTKDALWRISAEKACTIIFAPDLINGACHIWQGNISVIRHFQIPLFFRRATPPAVFVTEPWMRCQNVRPNREWCAMTFISDRGYDVRPRGKIAAEKNA